ncbi:Protein serine/threonine phosphatase PrpC, regulation of stationary phase [hydrothermal vent metagenome]|uniref:Protein serine/threonine phosphatase PrpC, regulation of stationary phase n=1 Tax=hydrothermal vent metagenome TaxID=652676 RepID=A0A3B0XTP0_9ZZZZ
MNNNKKYSIEHTVQSKRGDRAENQDSAEEYLDDKQSLFIVADGLGGHKNGRFAAHYFSERIIHHTNKYHTLLYNDPVTILTKIFSLAEQDLLHEAREDLNKRDARTTCVIAYCSDKITLSLHVGDSRFYLFDQNKINWQSKDHSIIQLLIDQNEITQQEANTHPDRNRIYKCLGGDTKQIPSIEELTPLTGSQSIVICSDGFWHTLDHPRLNQLITAHDFDLQLQSLSQQAVDEAKGRSDNVTAIAIRHPLATIEELPHTKPVKRV